MHDRNPLRTILICVALAAITAGVYWRTGSFDFVEYDDPDYVTANEHVKSGLTKESVRWAFTTGHADNWHPVTWLSHMLDCRMYGLKPGGPHLTNVLFHAVNAVLLFLVLLRMTGAMWRSAFVAGLFAWHPAHVESVAWISERKDVLSTFFWLLTMLAYVNYVQSLKFKVQGWRPKVHYALALSFFTLGLMSKPMLVTLPLVLLLLDYWPLDRIAECGVRSAELSGSETRRILKVTWTRAILEKAPFLTLAAASCVVTFAMQRAGGAVAGLNALSTGARLANALVSYPRYVGKIFWPVNLSCLYPMPLSWPWALVAAGFVFVAGMSLLAVWQAKRRPYLFVGWFWFVGTLVPVIGLVQVGAQSIANRYLYMPATGLFIVVAWGAADLLRALPLRNVVLAPIAALALAGCLVLCWMQQQYWQNSVMLFTHATEATENNIHAEYNLAKVLERAGKIDEAVADYRKALAMQPDPLNPLAETHYNLGTIFARRGQLDDAITQLQAAVRERPDYAEARINLAVALWNRGKLDEAIENEKTGVRLQPENELALNNLAMMQVEQGRFAEAVANLSELLRRHPNEPELQKWLGYALAGTGHFDEGVLHLKQAVQLRPNHDDGYLFLGDVLARQGKTAEARTLFAIALKIQPGAPSGLAQAAKAMNAQGRTNAAAMFGRLAREVNGEFSTEK